MNVKLGLYHGPEWWDLFRLVAALAPSDRSATYVALLVIWVFSVRFTSLRFGSVQFGSVRFGSVRFGSRAVVLKSWVTLQSRPTNEK